MADSDFQITPVLAADAQKVVTDAVAGIVRYGGEIDEMLQVEAQVKGFGGWFVANGEMVAVLKDPGDSLIVREVLDRQYANRTIPLQRQIGNTAIDAKIVGGRFALSELIAIQNKIQNAAMPHKGLTGWAVTLAMNRVEVGFADAASLTSGIETLKKLGLPRGALIPQIWGDISAM
jgi:hypothetical protein